MSTLISTNSLEEYSVHATDGDLGRVVEVFLDDARWVVPYMVVDSRSWLSGRKILLQPALVREAREAERELGVTFTRAQLSECPNTSTSQQAALLGLSRKKTAANWAIYQESEASPPQGEVSPPATTRRKGSFNDHLRSTRIAGSLAVHAQHEPIGFVADFLVDAKTWAIGALLIHLSGGRTIRLPPQHVGSIVLDENIVNVYLSPAAILSFISDESQSPHGSGRKLSK